MPSVLMESRQRNESNIPPPDATESSSETDSEPVSFESRADAPLRNIPEEPRRRKRISVDPPARHSLEIPIPKPQPPRDEPVRERHPTAAPSPDSGQQLLEIPPSNRDLLRSSSSNVTASTTIPGSVDDTQVPTKQGAYWVTKTTPPGYIIYRIPVPANCDTGSEFPVQAGNRRVQVTCPENCQPGQEIEITLPPESVYHYKILKPAQFTASPVAEDALEKGITPSLGGAVKMLPDIRKMNSNAVKNGGSIRTHVVTIPKGVVAGQEFSVNAGGQRFKVTCPPSAHEGQRIRIVPPVRRESEEICPAQQTFAVRIPNAVSPGQLFAFTVGTNAGQQVVVQCPQNASPGQMIQVQLPTTQVVEQIHLAYESQKKSGWRRTVRASDLKFQWMRLQQANTEHSIIASVDNFDFWKSAFVRKMTVLEGNDPKLPTAMIELVSADLAVVDSKLKVNGKTLLSYADIAAQQVKPLGEKHKWFTSICNKLKEAAAQDSSAPLNSENGYIKLFVRRSHLLRDSVRAVLSLGEAEMRREWKIGFMGEPAVDERGVAKDWFHCVTEQIFDPAVGLFVSSTNNQAAVDINPASSLACPDTHLVYYRFVGRMLGRALFDGHLVKGHLVRMLYKHLLGWPITYDDVKAQDEGYFFSLQKLAKMGDVSPMCLEFCVTEECLGTHMQKELIEGGSMVAVNNENLPEYLEAVLRYRLFDRTLPQLTEILLGFYDVIPEPALTIFDANELELILCGLPTIDLEDWQRNTEYKGLFENSGKDDPMVKWLWEVVEEEFDPEMRARLLQFATGTSGVPSQGFASLQGNGGALKKFTVYGVDVQTCLYPKAHTCFNQIDLPNYRSKEELKERLKVSLMTSFVGFDSE